MVKTTRITTSDKINLSLSLFGISFIRVTKCCTSRYQHLILSGSNSVIIEVNLFYVHTFFGNYCCIKNNLFIHIQTFRFHLYMQIEFEPASAKSQENFDEQIKTLY